MKNKDNKSLPYVDGGYVSKQTTPPEVYVRKAIKENKEREVKPINKGWH